MYREFMFIIRAYLNTLRKQEIIYEIIIPFLIALSFPFVFNKTLNKDIISSIISTMSITLGFVIATITILLTSNNSNLDSAKKASLNKKIFGKELNIFRKILILFFYIAFMALTELIVAIFTQYYYNISTYPKTISIINIFLTLHIIFISIRNLTNLFFVEFK